jgi:hypothetical protein
VLRVLHNPRYAGAFCYGRTTQRVLPGRKATSRQLPRDEWTSFIPGAHPGYISVGPDRAGVIDAVALADVCRLTGVADELAKAGFTVKRGGTQRWGANPEPWTFSFSVSPKLTGQTSYAYQVERSRFDQILLDQTHAKWAPMSESSATLTRSYRAIGESVASRLRIPTGTRGRSARNT